MSTSSLHMNGGFHHEFSETYHSCERENKHLWYSKSI